MAGLFRHIARTANFLGFSALALTLLASGVCAQTGSTPLSGKVSPQPQANSAPHGSDTKASAQSADPRINTAEIANRLDQELGIDLQATTTSWQRELDQIQTDLGRPRLRYSELNEFRDRLQGLRSQEVLDLNRDDLLLPEAQIRVRGKGNKTRFLPLAPEAAQLLDHYLRLERPTTSTNALFVSLKGPARGARMTPAGLRSLFRHHRRTTGVKIANPHRFRHTFASDMVRAGVSLPALMQLMGHAQIQTTLVYMQVTPLEVYQQYARAVAQLIRPVPVTPT